MNQLHSDKKTDHSSPIKSNFLSSQNQAKIKEHPLIVSSHNEWDPLKSVVIGIADNAQFPTNDFGLKVNIAEGDHQLPNLNVDIPNISQKIIEETNEDLAVFAVEMEKLGIEVLRPNPIDTSIKIQTPFWETNQFFNYCPRDILLVIGDTIIESANCERSRYFEAFSYRDILLRCMKGKAKWFSAPRPLLREMDYNINPNAPHTLNNLDPIFDAANIIRAGKDLFYLISGSGNQAGLHWLRNALGDAYRVHACPDLYSGVHIDSTLALLRPGLVLANPARVTKENLPKLLQQWDIIYTPAMQDYSYNDLPALSSEWLGMNLLMVNPNLAVVDGHQTELIKLLEKNNIDVLPLILRHGRTLGGGFHCVTADLRREGEKEEYFSFSK